MRTFFTLVFGVALVTDGAAILKQSKAASIQGVWQTVEVTIAGSNPRTITIAQPSPRFMIITAKHYSRTEVQSDGPRPVIPDVAKATADELRATWGPFVGEAGAYEVNGNVVTMHPLASKNPAAMTPGAVIVYTYKLDGNTLWLVQVRNQDGPYPSPATFKSVRVE